MTELVDFLKARLDEDEQMARAADGVTWTATKGLHDFSDGGGLAEMVTLSDSEGTPIATDLDGTFTADDLVHIAHHDPARVLREVEAKRRIIEEHPIARNTVTAEGDFSNAPGCATCHESDGEVIAFGYCRTLRLLALPYADHDDYRKEWGPDGT